MDLHFRRLVADDVPAVIDLTKDIWDGNDYMPGVIDRWIQHDESYTFGAFSDQAMHDMVGIARVRWFSQEVAWLEGGRVRPSFQKQGAGIQIAMHALEHVRNQGGKTCLYDTSSANHGSLAIAKRLGFTERDRVRVSVLETVKAEKAGFGHLSHPGKALEFLDVKEAIAAARNLPNPPGDYISNGWSWAPLDAAYLSRLPWHWARLGNAIALVMDGQASTLAESPEPGSTWLILHGDPRDAASLVVGLLASRLQDPAFTRAKPREPLQSVFCPEPIAPAIEALGFHPYQNEPEWVILLEKHP
ncbi:MAG: GNAT family N-acetyltransferase [Candidatus Lokiarchaeota archaeon]|nr:GNAT family N-acetyltransferase [Candidatus Lokiarchaeota archaeon]